MNFYRLIRNLFKKIYLLVQYILPKRTSIILTFHMMYLINLVTAINYKKKYGLKLLKETSGNFKKSDTLFILGSGSSINQFSDRQWREIKNHDSVGFNFWFLHEFVPSFYVYEQNLDKLRNDQFYNLLNLKKHKYNGIPFIVKDIEYKGLSCEKIPKELVDQFCISTDITFQGERKDLELFYSIGNSFLRSLNKKDIKVIIKKSGTLSYLICLAEQLGYKNIVLCGIDLKNNDYFYEDPSYNEKPFIPKVDKYSGQMHPTNQCINGNIPMEEIIHTINDTILVPKGIKLFIGSKNSALYPQLPYYFK